jgi:hypothetical protein
MKKKLPIYLIVSIIAIFGFALVFSSYREPACLGKIKLITPKEGVVISNNMPNLTWTPVQCSHYEIWIDGIKMDTVDKAQNAYTVFPLSYGKHQWQVMAIIPGKSIVSDVGHFTVDDKPLGYLPENALLLRYNWLMESSVLAGMDGETISSTNIETTNWYKTSLPATVLTVLVRNGVYPNPYIGLNNMKIPDCNDALNDRYKLLKYSHLLDRNPWKDPYWYRTSFEIPKNYEGKMIWLNLGEINYRAEVWLNGNKVADTSVLVGMERLFRLNIDKFVNKEGQNYLAIAIYPPDHPGKPDPEPITPLADPGVNMADGMIGKDYTRWDVLGWDWIPAVRDRDMGLVEDVYLSATDNVELDNLYVTSDLPLPDTSSADITISADVVNHSNMEKEGIVTASVSIDGKEFTFNQDYKIKPNDTTQILFDKTNVPQLHLVSPKLWWPYGYGDQNLYSLKIEIKGKSGETSIRKINFGIRKVETYIGSKERIYKVNGKEIYCKGGNWVLDMMLNWTARRYEDEILLTKNSNLNILRIWGPTGAPPESFYDAADKYGVLLWQDFLNDYWGTFKNSPNLKPVEKLFEQATIDIVKKYRNHPSLVIWCGGNEGPNPREELIMKKILPKYDGRDSKHYLKISNGDGLHGGGPYHTIEPKDYFKHDRVLGFSSEIGPSGVPVYESMIKFLPQIGYSWMPGRFPLDGDCAYHDATDRGGSDMRKYSNYDNIIRKYYGAPDSTRPDGVIEYANKCQILNFEVYRASIEAINRYLWENASGIALWKSNAAWPSLTWQVYDWYLQAHAGFYGTKKAGEMVHVQMNRDDYKIVVLNSTHKRIGGTKVSSVLYDSNLAKIWDKQENVDLLANSVAKTEIVVPVDKKLSFLKLELKDKEGKLISENFYWLQADDDYKGLNILQPAIITGNVKVKNSRGRAVYDVSVKNTGKCVAFMLALKFKGKESGQEVLPSLWSDNYFSLLPGESKTVTLNINPEDIQETVQITAKSYNMAKEIVLKY